MTRGFSRPRAALLQESLNIAKTRRTNRKFASLILNFLDMAKTNLLICMTVDEVSETLPKFTEKLNII